MSEHERCEAVEAGPDGCRARGAWLVQAGTRKMDAQLSCGRHLNQVCFAMAAAELPRHAALTVTYIEEGR